MTGKFRITAWRFCVRSYSATSNSDATTSANAQRAVDMRGPSYPADGFDGGLTKPSPARRRRGETVGGGRKRGAIAAFRAGPRVAARDGRVPARRGEPRPCGPGRVETDHTHPRRPHPRAVGMRELSHRHLLGDGRERAADLSPADAPVLAASIRHRRR